MQNFIKIIGAKENNLKDVNLTIPRDKLVFLQAFQVAVSQPWPLIPYLQKVKDVIWKAYLVMQECF